MPVLSLVKALSLGAKKVRPSYEFLSARQGLDLVGSADTPARRASDSATAMALRASEWRGQRLAVMAPPLLHGRGRARPAPPCAPARRGKAEEAGEEAGHRSPRAAPMARIRPPPLWPDPAAAAEAPASRAMREKEK